MSAVFEAIKIGVYFDEHPPPHIIAFLRAEPHVFDEVKCEECGGEIDWLDPEGDEIDFGSDALGHRAERQAEILRLASELTDMKAEQ